MELFALVEGQTLLRRGRFRFLRRIGSGTFAVILRALDVQSGRTVAIKCMQRQEYNAIGKQEAAILQQVSSHDPDAHCAVVRLLDTFVEQELFCLVLELLGDAVLNVSLWGPWRQPYQERSLHSPGSARRHKLHSVVGIRASTTPVAAVAPSASSSSSSSLRSASPVPVSCPSISPLSLDDARQIAAHLCGALALLHSQGLIHADLKPENIVRSPPSASSPVKLVDFGNCIESHKIVLYEARDKAKPMVGFDVQTLAYRAPEVAAGLEISSAIDMWSLGCVLLECVTGEPLFTTSAAVFGVDAISGHETENEVILRQIELLVNRGKPLSAVQERYQAAGCYSGPDRVLLRKRQRPGSTTAAAAAAFPSLSERVEATGLHGNFHDFIERLLDVNPDTRLTARGALLHPFVQAFFPFKLVFSSLEPAPRAETAASPSMESKNAALQLLLHPLKQKREPEQRRPIKSQPKELRVAKNLTSSKSKKKKQRLGLPPTANAGIPNSSQSSSLRAALKLIPAMKLTKKEEI